MFAAVYVINLERSPDRWASLQPVLRHMGIADAIRFPGVDGAAADINSLQQQGRLSTDLAHFHAHCRAGEIGCALSHSAVLAEIVAQRIPSALILEDDIALAGRAASWRRRAERAQRSLPAGWELWFLYRCFDVRGRVERISSRIVRPWTPQGCAAYAVTLEGARKILGALTPVANAVDRVIAPLVKERKIRAFAASPQLVLPGAHPSIINDVPNQREWVRNGINRPPEYWPSRSLAHLGEPPEPWPRRLWETITSPWQDAE